MFVCLFQFDSLHAACCLPSSVWKMCFSIRQTDQRARWLARSLVWWFIPVTNWAEKEGREVLRAVDDKKGPESGVDARDLFEISSVHRQVSWQASDIHVSTYTYIRVRRSMDMDKPGAGLAFKMIITAFTDWLPADTAYEIEADAFLCVCVSLEFVQFNHSSKFVCVCCLRRTSRGWEKCHAIDKQLSDWQSCLFAAPKSCHVYFLFFIYFSYLRRGIWKIFQHW